jgi:hypothetical protein
MQRESWVTPQVQQFERVRHPADPHVLFDYSWLDRADPWVAVRPKRAEQAQSAGRGVATDEDL